MTQPNGPGHEERPHDHDVAHLLGAVHDHLGRIESILEATGRPARSVERHLAPAWRRATEGEHRLPVAAAVAAAIALQVFLSRPLAIHPVWLLPALEGALMLGLVAYNPRRINRTSAAVRAASVGLTALISLANGFASAELIKGLIEGTNGDNAALLLGDGANVYVTNILVFALWYWEWDRGGPVSRARGERPYPDFLFPQMSTPSVAPPDWEPTFLDYLYLSFTNATAFSPTDTMPLSRWAKMLMAAQSTVALTTVGLVIARAVNVLK